MTEKYGYLLDDWNKAKEEIRHILAERAKLRGMIPYSELCQKVGAISLEPNSYALAAMLGEVSSAEDDLGHGLLTVIVVHKDGDMQPGPGFFELAKERGRDTSDREKCWVDELKKVYRYWSGVG